MIPRRAAAVAVESLTAFRVLVIHGARQVGKSTLARELGERRSAVVVSLDSALDRSAAVADPETFLEAHGKPLVVDEIQRAGQPLVLAVKAVVDLDNTPGQYILTGSSNFLTVPGISESLAGRVDIVTLWPLSQGELRGSADGFVDRAFEGLDALLDHAGAAIDRDEYFEQLCIGGFPAVQYMTPRQRRRWFGQYVNTVLEREVATAGDLRRFDALEAMVRYFASTTGQELVLTAVAERLGLDRGTAATYQPWLETVFLVHRVPAWSRNLTSKVVKRPKIHMVDTGVAAGLLGRQPDALRLPTDPAAGPLVETFAVNELAKQLTWCETFARLFHYRDRDGFEVDAILERDDGAVVAIEVKATSTPRAEDFRGVVRMRDAIDRAGGRFVAGVVLHTGSRRMPFGDRLGAFPLADLWT